MTENIGYKLRRLREDGGLTVDTLSDQSGVQKSQIELIEKGMIQPSLSTLIKLARTLGIRLGTFLDGMESPEPTLVSEQKQQPQGAVCLSNGRGADTEHLKYCALAENKPDRNMEPFIINVEYTSPDDPGALSHHEGEEFIYVLEGEIEVRYGKEIYNVKKNESIYFDSIVPHCLSTVAAEQKAKVLAVVYTPF